MHRFDSSKGSSQHSFSPVAMTQPGPFGNCNYSVLHVALGNWCSLRNNKEFIGIKERLGSKRIIRCFALRPRWCSNLNDFHPKKANRSQQSGLLFPKRWSWAGLAEPSPRKKSHLTEPGWLLSAYHVPGTLSQAPSTELNACLSHLIFRGPRR